MSNLLRISEAASLGMHAMAVLSSRPKARLSAGDIASMLGVSEAHLAKVLQRLARAGLVSSARGPTGGFELPASRRSVTLLEVYEAIDGPYAPDNCLMGLPACLGKSCILGDLVRSVNGHVRKQLASTKVSQLAGLFAEG